MATELRSAFEGLTTDSWRNSVGFSSEIAEAQERLFARSADPSGLLSAWLQKYQPCLFGRVAAKQDLIRYCFLFEEDLRSDEAVRDKIQAARLRWTKEAFEGRASAFVILFVSPRLAAAVPDMVMMKFACRLCSLYLREVDVKTDTVLHERVCLEKPGDGRMTWEWLAGVNYFSAQADRRWWSDHRIPGGVGFSINSVGHMVKAGKIGEHMQQLANEIGLEESDFGGGTIRSLNDALKYAMLTINNASEAVSGKATELLDAAADDEAMTSCPVVLPRQIASKNYCTYSGWYHTDYSLPSEYFRADAERPSDLVRHQLDFTYLFSDDVENPAHETMGTGHRIRAELADDAEYPLAKRNRMLPVEVEIEKNPILTEALSQSRYWK